MKTVSIYCDQHCFRIIVDRFLIDNEESRAKSFLLLQEFQEFQFAFAFSQFLYLIKIILDIKSLLTSNDKYLPIRFEYAFTICFFQSSIF